MQKHLKFIGITGTNGKTTTTYLVQSILQSAGYKATIIGTLTGKLTTPSPWDIQKAICNSYQKDDDWIVMEVSSHGIQQNRVQGIYFTIKALTNITQDHLDYHKTMKAYKKVKLDWFFAGDSHKASLWPDLYKDKRVHTTKIHGLSDKLINKKNDYQSFYDNNRQLASNICKCIGIDNKIIKQGLETAPVVPGRFELVSCGQSFPIVIDYAHTPDGLEKVLAEARFLMKKNHKTGKLILVFGCGGDRDQGKRPKMGRIATKMANIVIITSDNPRTEDPDLIIQDILNGIDHKKKNLNFPKNIIERNVAVEKDRAKAIHNALSIATENDLVLIAGKGHEDYQILKDKIIHFSDKEEIEKYFL